MCINLYFSATVGRHLNGMGSSDVDTSRNNEVIGKFVKFFIWKLQYLRSNGMINSENLANDLNKLCELIDKNCPVEDAKEIKKTFEGQRIKIDSHNNFAINEVLAYFSTVLLPLLLKNQFQPLLQEELVQDGLLNLMDVIVHKCK